MDALSAVDLRVDPSNGQACALEEQNRVTAAGLYQPFSFLSSLRSLSGAQQSEQQHQ
jgi:hypothetical protein